MWLCASPLADGSPQRAGRGQAIFACCGSQRGHKRLRSTPDGPSWNAGAQARIGPPPGLLRTGRIGPDGMGKSSVLVQRRPTPLRSRFLHPKRLPVGDHDHAVMEQSIEQADRGGVLGEELAPLLEGPV
jgi:hypothetical protein